MLIFNGINFEREFGKDFRIVEINGRGLSEQENDLLIIPGRNGAYHRSKRRNPRIIEVVFDLKSDSYQDLNNKIIRLNEMLDVDTPTELYLPDENDRVRFAIPDGELEWEESTKRGKGGRGSIIFLCPDPYSYSNEIVQDLIEYPHVINGGTAETYPIFEIEPLEPITYFEILNTASKNKFDKYPVIKLGQPAEIDETPYEPQTLVFHDTMQSTQGWQQASEVDNGYISGEIDVDSKGFYPSLFGPGIEPDTWQGPSLQKGIGTPLQDFRADILIENMNQGAEMGMLAVYFRDANGRKLANIGFGDTWKTRTENFGHAQVGPYHSGERVDAYADNPNAWNNFNGIMRIERIDNVWKFYYARIEKDGSHNWVHSRGRIVDAERNFMSPVTTVQVAFRLWYGAERTNMHIKDIKIYRVNKPGEDEELVLNDEMKYLSPWSTATEVDNGIIDGEIGVDEKGFYPKLFGPGTQSETWQGPSLIRPIGYPLQDFRAEIRIENINSVGKMGMMAVYFRDSSGKKVANIGFGDTWLGRQENFGHAQVGPYDTGPRVDAYADSRHGWNNFDGVMRIERIDNVWKVYFARIEPDGSHNWIWSKGVIEDKGRQYMQPVTHVQVAFRKWTGFDETDMHIKGLKIYRLTPKTTSDIPYIAKPGDKISINTKTSQVLLNGEYANDLLMLESEMFTYKKGINRLEYFPKNIKLKTRFRKAYL